MKEHPILFSGPMVRAILNGSKTQTRRVVKWQGPRGFPHFFNRAFLDNPAGVRRLNVPYHHPKDNDIGKDNPAHRHYPPYGEPGDRLWVKETFMPMTHLNAKWFYRATDPLVGGKWKSSIFCPRAASRITLEITEVTVERLNDITEADAIEEGVDIFEDGAGFTVTPGGSWQRNPEDAYRNLWESINGPGSWAANPWVWVIGFRRVNP